MNMAPFLLAAAALFWGWQAEFLPAGILIAVVLEGARFTAWRWDLTFTDFRRVALISEIALAGLAVYLLLTTDAGGAIAALKTLRQWLPLVLFPLVLAQLFSTSQKVELAALLLFQPKTQAGWTRKSVNLAYPYLVVLVLAASATNMRTPWFYAGLCLLLVWALWGVRPKTYSPALWSALLASAIGLGYAGHVGLHTLQAIVEESVTQMVFNFVSGGETDPYRSTTAMGHIGEMKQSDEIVLRVTMAAGEETPMLLHGASYNRYQAAAWYARGAEFEILVPEADGTTWKLQAASAPMQGMTVSAYLTGGKGVLALPLGTGEVRQLVVGGAKRNRFGVVQVDNGPGLITYSAQHGRESASESPPTDADLALPTGEAAVVTKIAAELGLDANAPRRAMQTVAGYFQSNFAYSLYQAKRMTNGTPLEEFLLRTKAGHCEYFATATALILRAAGIPARYATGYSVQEFSPLENVYVVRARHAHAWTRVYVDGAWRDFDTTPVSWATVEGKQASRWEPLADLWAWGKYQYAKWRWGERKGTAVTSTAWLLAPLLLILAWRFYAAKRIARSGNGRTSGGVRDWPGRDSEFYALEKRLTELGHGRQAWEPVSAWLHRLSTAQPRAAAADQLEPIAVLHNRYRFDPNGISAHERKSLQTDVQTWLTNHSVNS